VTGYAQAGHFERQAALARVREYLEGGGTLPSVPPDSAGLLAPVSQAQGVGERRKAILAKLGIATIEDLLTYFPRRLEDRTRFQPIGELGRGEETGVRAEILAVDQVRVSRAMTVVKAAVDDGTGLLYAVWFNQPWLARELKRGERIDLFGRVEWSHGERQMRTPVWEPAGAGKETGRLVPIYPATEGVSDRLLRSLIARNLALYGDLFPDVVPAALRERLGLLKKAQAVRAIHVPEDEEAFRRAGAGPEDTEDIINHPRAIDGVRAVVLLKQWERGVVRVSLRSIGAVDVRRIAERLGGGGHANAAGCTVRADLASARELVVAAVREAVEAAS
jgi:hypothetical protein